jgi:hypothetical protein
MGRSSDNEEVPGHLTFSLVYGTEVVFPTQLALPVAKFFQDHEGEPDHMVRRIHQVVEVQQIREQVMDRAYSHQQKIKQAFDRKVRKKEFELGNLVLKWDAPRQDRGKHNKFDALWMGPSKSLKYSRITLTGCRIWRVKKFLMAQ